MPGWVTEDSGEREQYESGMRRDTEGGKARFDLVMPEDVPYEEQMLTRDAELMARGALKYGDRNWELAATKKELRRYYSSAFRHLVQWLAGMTNEDHAAAVRFNVMAAETVKYKMKHANREGIHGGNEDSAGKEGGGSSQEGSARKVHTRQECYGTSCYCG